jgi:PAS domain-containing protein
MEAVAERPDGTRVHFIPYPTPLYDASGTLIGAVNMLIDISDRRRADAHGQRLASIVESSQDAIVSKDLVVPSVCSATKRKRSSASQSRS